MRPCEICGDPTADEMCPECMTEWLMCEDARLLINDETLTDEERLQKFGAMYP